MLNTQPVAYSQRYYYRAFLRSNRLLGVPNPVVSAVVVLALGCTGWAVSELPLVLYLSRYGVWLGAISLGIWGVIRSASA